MTAKKKTTGKAKSKAKSKAAPKKTVAKVTNGFRFLEKQVNEYGATCLFKNVRLAWINLARPNTKFGKKDRDGNVYTGHYEISMMIPEDEKFLTQLEKTIESICNQSKKLKGAQEKKRAFKAGTSWYQDGCFVKDGDNILDKNGTPYEGFPGNYIIKAKTGAEMDTDGNWKSQKNVKVIHANKVAIAPDKIESELYGGVFADVQVNICAYSTGKNIGVTVYLDGVMKTGDGARLGSTPDFFDDRSDEMNAFEDSDNGDEGI